jgi:hydroxymethylbilane synthase
LAIWQATWVANRLTSLRPGLTVDIVRTDTRGDAHAGSFVGLAEKGVFTSELELALLAEEIDLAVHSLKDLPVEPSPEVVIAAVPLRDDPRDVLVSRERRTLAELPAGSRIGTSSPRRTSLLYSRREDVEVVPIRGNVDTRVRRLEEGAYDAIVLAAAGLARLGLEGVVSEWFDPRAFPPAPGQGALAVQVRAMDTELIDAVGALDRPEARETATAERSLLAALGGGCSKPIGAHAWRDEEGLTLVGLIGSADGRRMLRSEASGSVPETLGTEVANRLLDAGAAELLA